ncbi:MAG: hypothetical protein NTX44_11270 [Ignavibacteriales bacterium]|nr:hypothetical protein [Ignavibacteriales bacterium]
MKKQTNHDRIQLDRWYAIDQNILSQFVPDTKHNRQIVIVHCSYMIAPPNGWALSCGVDNFQVAENETGSCTKPN